MGYYIRVLGTNLAEVPIQRLKECASPALIESDEMTDSWQQLVLRHPGGPEIAVIEKNPVGEGELGAEELKEFLDEIPSYRPSSAVSWLQHYLPSVKVVYAFQLLSGTDVDDGWSRLHAVYNTVWQVASGILQADGEGFSNEDGYTILWQFGETARGEWNVGLLVDGAWKHFEIDLGSQQHRERSGTATSQPGRNCYSGLLRETAFESLTQSKKLDSKSDSKSARCAEYADRSRLRPTEEATRRIS